jgi:hypothetical protein
MTQIIFTTVPGRLDLRRVHDFRFEPWHSDKIVSRPLGRPALARVDSYGIKGSFRLYAADEGSSELRGYICSKGESMDNLPSSDLLVGDMVVYTESGTFKYNSVNISLPENDPQRLDHFIVRFKATDKKLAV